MQDAVVNNSGGLKTSDAVMSGPLIALREAEIRLLTDIADSLGEMGEGAGEDRQRLIEIAQDLREMFYLVVVIGEFNAGKSSFINALLGDDLLPTGVLPTTEMIEVVRYNETPQRKPVLRDDSTREWAHPNTGAPGVALVDTPGTGSVFQKHENTAKSFLHRSDLVIFLLFSKRALAETERLYLELAQHYGKKIILVINQADLLSPAERAEVRRFVERQVDELLGIKPLLFMVSARQALQGRDNPALLAESGMDAVKAHLRGVFSESPPVQQKLLSQLEMGERILQQYGQTVQSRADLVTVDTAKVRDVQRELEQQSQGLNLQLKGARAEIDQVFEQMQRRGRKFVQDNLTVRRLARPLSKDQLQVQFNETVVGQSLRDVSNASNAYVNALIDHSRLYWRGIIERLNQLRALMEQELAGLDAGVYAEQREALQEAIRIAENELKSYSRGDVVREIDETFRSNMSAFTTSSIAALSGIVLTALAIAAPGGVIGAGAIATATVAFVVGAPLALIGGAAMLRYYRRIERESTRELETRIESLQKSYNDALEALTQRERTRLGQYGNQVLTPFFSRLDVLTQKYAGQQATLKGLQDQLVTLRRGIQEAT